MPENVQDLKPGELDEETMKSKESSDRKSAAKAAVEETKRVLDSLVERIYDSQKKTGLWASEGEDQSAIVADMHSLVSSGYMAWNNDAIEEASLMFGRVAIACLGICRSMGHNVGGLVLAEVIEQARSAESVSTEAEAEGEKAEQGENGEKAASETDVDADENDDLLASLGTDDPDMLRLLEEIEAEGEGL